MISRAEALDMFHSDDLIGIGMEADSIRRRLHPSGVVSYIVGGQIDHTLPRETTGEKIRQILELGGTGIALRGGIVPDRTIEAFEDLLRSLKREFEIRIHGFSTPELVNIADLSGLSMRDTIARLRDAGLDSLPGDGVETAQWAEVHRIAHSLGIPTTAEIMFGRGETFEQRLNHFDVVRQIQEDTGGFTAFIPCCSPETTAVEHLRTLAISRIFLDNIPNLQSSWGALGLKTCQLGLRFGANDTGNIAIEGKRQATEEELRRTIRDAGFVPKQRDALYRTYFLN